MKKNFIPEGNPVLNILGYDEVQPEKNIAPTEKKVVQPVFEDDADIYSVGAAKTEPRSKRLNLLIKPSDFKEISKIAARHSISVNELINRLVESCIKNNKN